MKSIFICGAHSAGKSTLCVELSKRIGLPVLSEVGRKLLEEMQITRHDLENDIQIRKDYQARYIKAQCVRERELQSNGNFISDRGIDPLVYSAFYVKDDGSFYRELLKMKETQENIERYRKALVVVLKPHPACIQDDGIRMVSPLEELAGFTIQMEDILKENDIPYHLIDDTHLEVPILEERVVKVLSLLA